MQQRAIDHRCYYYNIIGSDEYITNYEIIVIMIFAM
jgi:hypothetical protein